MESVYLLFLYYCVLVGSDGSSAHIFLKYDYKKGSKGTGLSSR